MPAKGSATDQRRDVGPTPPSTIRRDPTKVAARAPESSPDSADGPSERRQRTPSLDVQSTGWAWIPRAKSARSTPPERDNVPVDLLSIGQTEMDGVQVIWPEVGADATFGGLMFRVGPADETLVTRGISHLVQELAVDAADLTSSCDRSRTDALTCFEFGGSVTFDDDELLALLLAELSGGLASHDLSAAPRLQRRLLLDAVGSGNGTDDWLAIAHFGASGYGLGAHDELGLASLSAEPVLGWWARHFVGHNAIAWFDGEPPPALHFGLPSGRRVPPPRAAPLAFPRPAWMRLPFEAAGVSMLEADTAAARVARRCVVVRLCDLVQERGLPLRVWTEAVPLDGHQELSSVWCHDPSGGAPGGALVRDIAARFAEEGPSAREITAAAAVARTAWRNLDRPGDLARWVAMHSLLCDDVVDPRRRVRDVEDLSVEDVREAWCESMATAIWMVPASLEDPSGYGTSLDSWNPSVLEGRVFRPAERADPTDHEDPTDHVEPDCRLVIGTSSITEVAGGEQRATVRFAACAALARWRGTHRTVYDLDGSVIHLDPDEWRDGPRAVRMLDEQVPRAVHLDVGLPPPVLERLADPGSRDGTEALR